MGIELTGDVEVEFYISQLMVDLANGLAEVVLETSNDLRDDIQAQMPVDTGWAQMRWGEPAYGGIWEESNAGLTIEQGSGIEPYEYIEKLNAGSSKQAPAGFIDVAAARAELKLESAIETMVGEATA